MLRLLTWLLYTICCFAVMLIGFELKVSISVSIIVGFVCMLLNEIIFFQKYGNR